MQHLTLGACRRVARDLQSLNEIKVTAHADLEPDMRDLPNFFPVEKYQSVEWLVRKLMLGEDLLNTKVKYADEIGKLERFRFVISLDEDLRCSEADAEDVYGVVFEVDDKRIRLDVASRPLE